MQWNFGSIIDYISNIISPGTALSPDYTAYVKNLINVSVGGIAITFPINELKLPDHYVRTAADYATGTVTATDGSPTVTGSATTAWTYKMIGRKIAIDDERTYYTIIDVTAVNSLTLDRNYNGTGGAGLTYNIFENTFDLPDEIGATGWVKGVFDPSRNSGDIDEVSWDWIDHQDPALQDTGTVEKYALPGNKIVREPFGTTNYTATIGTSASTITSPYLKVEVAGDNNNDYYNDWIVVNVTRSKTSKVIDYDASSFPTLIYLEEEIAGQTIGDSFYLLKQAPQITFYRRPNEVKDYLVKGYKATPKLLNLYDVPLLSEDFLGLIAAQVLTIYYGNDPLATKWKLAEDAELEILKSKYARKTDSRQREGMFKKTGRIISFQKQES